MSGEKVMTCILLTLLLFAGVKASDNSEKRSIITPDAYIGFETGQYVRARYKGRTLKNSWQGNFIGRAGLAAVPNDWLALKIGLEGRIWYNNYPVYEQLDPNRPWSPFYTFYFHEAQGIFSVIRDKPIGLEFALGLFPYKYNPEARDLGEYLFRTGTYPVYFIGSFDFPLARLTGLRSSFSFNTPAEVAGSSVLGIKWDILGLTEREMPPYHDFTLASILSLNFFNLIEIGGGVSFAHLIPVNKKATTRKDNSNNWAFDSLGVDNDGNTIYDTTFYTFKGTKLMLRSTIDPVFFLRERDGFLGDLFGKNGLKLYGEIAIIGFKDYPADLDNPKIAMGLSPNNPWGYDKAEYKRPFMFGFTLPCWKILDILSVEFEMFSCPYENNLKHVLLNDIPTPFQQWENPESVYDSTDFRENKWKFAVYCKKNIADHIGLIFQASRDHQGWQGDGANWQNIDWGQAFVRWNEWGWMFKVEYMF